MATHTPGRRRESSESVDGDTRLDNLRAIIDTDLNVRSPETLLGEMLDRVRTVLEADTVTVLLLDERGDNLVSYATRGLEDDMRQGIRVRVGAGFVGGIAARRQPATLDSVGPETVTNPLLWEAGLRTMLGVPMVGDDTVVGVLHVGRRYARPFTAEDTELLLVAAERLTGAVTTQKLATETAAARLLEQSLLPSSFPSVDGAEFAGRYRAATARVIGGDWYDVFEGPSGDLWLVVGDVVGHGLGSAVVMGRVRSALRAYTLLGGGPCQVLELTDRKVHHFEMGRMTTALCAVAVPPYDSVEISCAGQPAPILAVPGTEPQLVPVTTDPPLGAVRDVRRTSVTVPLPLGAVLALYTDGLVERRGEPIDVGMDRARSAVTCDHPEVVCRSVMSAMVGRDVPDDDTALLVMRRTASVASEG